MADPALSPGTNYPYTAALAPDQDQGWHQYPGVTVWSFVLDDFMRVTGWQPALQARGYRCANYSQIDPTGPLARWWTFTAMSAVPRWHWPPFHWTIHESELPVESPQLDALPDLAPEVTPGVGDGLVAAAQATVTMRNTGAAAWTAADGYRLGAQGPQENGVWGRNRVELPVPSVVPGQDATFSFPITAPATPGQPTFQWRMVQDGVEWFGDLSPATTVNVTPAG